MTLQDKVIFITGASRGIGKSIALKLASEGATIAIAAKSVSEDPRLGGTIYSAKEEIESMGGKALALQCDIRDEEQVIRAVQETIATYGRIDGLINNASAINLSGTALLEAKRFDLLHQVNVRGTFLVTKHCLPFLQKADNAHVITLSPPINMSPIWFQQYAAYTISKYSMTMLTMGWAAEYKKDKIAANTLWPATTIATSAVRNLLGGDALIARSRKPEIMADAVYQILIKPSDACTGNTFIDEDVLKEAGITDFSIYDITPGAVLQKDLFLS